MPAPRKLDLIEAEYQKGEARLQNVELYLKKEQLKEIWFIDQEVSKVLETLKELKKQAIKKANRGEPFLADLQKAAIAPVRKLVDITYEKGKANIATEKHKAMIYLRAKFGEQYEELDEWKNIVLKTNEARGQLKQHALKALDSAQNDELFNLEFTNLLAFIKELQIASTTRLTALDTLKPHEAKHDSSSIPHRQAPDKTFRKFEELDDSDAEEVKEQSVSEDSLDSLLLMASDHLRSLSQLNGESRLLSNTVDTVIHEIERELAVIKSSDLKSQDNQQLQKIIAEIDIYLVVTRIKVIAQELAKYNSDNPKKEEYLKIVEEMREERRQIKASPQATLEQIKAYTALMEERFKVLETERDRIANDTYKLKVLSDSLAEGYKQLANMLEGEFKKKYEKRVESLKKYWSAFLTRSLTYTTIEAHLNKLQEDLASLNQQMKAIGELQTAAKNLWEKLPEQKPVIQNQLKSFLNQDPFPTLAKMAAYKTDLESEINKLNQPAVVVPNVDRTLTNSGANLFSRSSPVSGAIPVVNEPAVKLHVSPDKKTSL